MARIVIADRHEFFPDFIDGLFSQEAERLDIVFRTTRSSLLPVEIQSIQADLLLMDVHFPDEKRMDSDAPEQPGIEACRKIRAQFPNLKILIANSFDNPAALFELHALGSMAS